MQKYRPQEYLMSVFATPNEVIVLGHVITSYLNHLTHLPKKTKDHEEIITLLQSFQHRLAHPLAAMEGQK